MQHQAAPVPPVQMPKYNRKKESRRRLGRGGKGNQRAVILDRWHQGIAIKGSWLVLFLMLLCLQRLVPVKATARERASVPLEEKVSAGKVCDDEGKMVKRTSHDEQWQRGEKEEREWERWKNTGKNESGNWKKGKNNKYQRGKNQRKERRKAGYKGWSWWKWSKERTKQHAEEREEERGKK